MDNTEVFFGMAYAIGLNPLGEMEAGMMACEGVLFNDRCYVR
jgi:hypothetical protein